MSSDGRPVYEVGYGDISFECSREWVEQIRQRYGLVTIDGGMPRQPCGMTLDGQYEGWYLARPDGSGKPGVWRRHDSNPWDGLSDWQILGLLNEMACKANEYRELRNRELLRSFRRERLGTWPPREPGKLTRGRQYETDEMRPEEWWPG